MATQAKVKLVSWRGKKEVQAGDTSWSVCKFARTTRNKSGVHDSYLLCLPQRTWCPVLVQLQASRWSTLLCWLSRLRPRDSASNAWRMKTTDWRHESPLTWLLIAMAADKTENFTLTCFCLRRRNCTLSSPLCLLCVWPNLPTEMDNLKCSLAPSTAKLTSSWKHCCRWAPT